MRPPRSIRFVLVSAALAGSVWPGRADDANRHDARAIVARVGERVAAYYKRAQQLICRERSTVVPIDSSWTAQGIARTVESELRVELDALDGAAVPSAQVTRQVLRVNGREPRERDRRNRSGCTDPTPISPEPLTFLLPGHRDEYRFTSVHDGHERDRAALVIDFTSAERSSRPELVEDEYGHDDCFDWKGRIAIGGRLWVDADSYDVLRLDRHVLGPTDVRVPWALQRKYHFDPSMTLDRDDLTLRYKAVSFDDPHETVLLPASTESTTVFRGGLQSIRRTEVFSDYRRFLTDGRIKGESDRD
jgi:hypothetical protein